MSSIAKGNRYERNVVKKIQEIWRLSSDEVFRTPRSGGHPSIRGFDIMFKSDVFWKEIGLGIECKWRNKANVWNFDQIYRGDSFINEVERWQPTLWLKEAVEKNEKDWITPILVFGKPRFPDYVLFRYEDFLDSFVVTTEAASLGYYGLIKLERFLLAFGLGNEVISSRMGKENIYKAIQICNSPEEIENIARIMNEEREEKGEN